MHSEWGWLVAIYLFLGGLGAGTFLVAATFELSGKRYQFNFCSVTLVGAIVSGPLVALGAVLLIFDLGAGLREPERIFYMFTHFSSVMTWGIWILSAFIPLSLVYGVLEVMDTFPRAWAWITGSDVSARQKLDTEPIVFDLVRTRELTLLRQLPIRRVKKWVTAIGSVLAVGTALYTGVLLGAVGPAVPFWSTPVLSFLPIPMMPLLFLVSAVSAGVGLTVDVGATLSVGNMQHRIQRLPLIHLALIGAETMLVCLLFITAFVNGGAAAQAARDIVIGPHSIVFWVLIVLPGLIFPFAVHVYAVSLGRHSTLSGLGSGVGILFAGLFLRYLIIISGVPAFL